MKTKSIIKIAAICLASLIGALILVVAIYLIYVAAQYSRIEDNLPLDISQKTEAAIKADGEYSLITYNLGFGAYSPEYSFFMDEGEMNDGTKTVGKYAKGISKADVKKNVDGQADFAKTQSADFYFFQEIDTNSDRSYHINMLENMCEALSVYSCSYAVNFHTAKLLYPFNDPIGKSNSGIATYSRYREESSVRRSFPVTSAFPDKFFDLDRCFSVTNLPIDGGDRYLVLINLHMSAYDKGGTIRAEQLKMLNGVLSEEYKKGNYVIAGGDFNHCLIADNFESDGEALTYFKSGQKVPEWVKNSILHNSEIAEGFSIAAPLNAATCRGADIPYEEGVDYSTVIDGFLISSNVKLKSVETVERNYTFSDHNPVKLVFELL